MAGVARAAPLALQREEKEHVISYSGCGESRI